MAFKQMLKRLAALRRYSRVSYDGTPVSPLSQVEYDQTAFSKDIETVELAFDKHAIKNHANGIPDLVFLHGLFGNRANNKSISKQLSKQLGVNVYCLDLRNHGESPWNSRHDYPAMAADVERFMTDHEIEKPIILGHSMGAKCAMALVLRNKEMCSGLVSIDNAPVDFTLGRTGFSKFGTYIQALQKIETKKLSSLKECDTILAEVEPSLPIRQFLLTNMKRKGDHFQSRVPLATLGASLDNISAWPYRFDGPQGARWNQPSLFIRGMQSSYVSDEVLATIGSFFPSFETLDIDAGHWVTAEKPAECVSGITGFVERHFSL